MNACQVMVSATTCALTLRDLITVNVPQGSSWIQMEDLARVCHSWWKWMQVYLRQRRSTGKCLLLLSHPSSFTPLCKPQGQIPHEASYRYWVDQFLLEALRIKRLVYVTDHDECLLGKHGCQQKCNNYHGGFYCSCNLGYELNKDNKTCSGKRPLIFLPWPLSFEKHISPPPFLLIRQGNSNCFAQRSLLDGCLLNL